MRRPSAYQIVFVTAPNIKTARDLARQALENHLAACANLVPKVESHYWWQGKLEASQEILLIFKTTQAKLSALQRCILAHHPYETPEFISVPIGQGSAPYLKWIADSVK
jgi:periplasmic divalent cation tolerance protein